MSYNAWLYGFGNPVNLTDPSGMFPPRFKTGNQVARFIVQRIREDSQSEAIQAIRKLNSTQYYADACARHNQLSGWEKVLAGSDSVTDAALADAGARAGALAYFGCLVADARSRPVCGQWDYKKEIGDLWGEAQTVDFSVVGINEEVIFYYDIWANIHFGYLGMVGGFSEDTLLQGAALEHAASNGQRELRDDPSDVVANKIGIFLYQHHLLSEVALLWSIYLERGSLNKAEIDEFGDIIKSYR